MPDLEGWTCVNELEWSDNYITPLPLPLHKKGDKTVCENYWDISSLNSAYKILSKILVSRLVSNVEENII